MTQAIKKVTSPTTPTTPISNSNRDIKRPNRPTTAATHLEVIVQDRGGGQVQKGHTRANILDQVESDVRVHIHRLVMQHIVEGSALHQFHD